MLAHPVLAPLTTLVLRVVRVASAAVLYARVFARWARTRRDELPVAERLREARRRSV